MFINFLPTYFDNLFQNLICHFQPTNFISSLQHLLCHYSSLISLFNPPTLTHTHTHIMLIMAHQYNYAISTCIMFIIAHPCYFSILNIHYANYGSLKSFNNHYAFFGSLTSSINSIKVFYNHWLINTINHFKNKYYVILSSLILFVNSKQLSCLSQ